ncbi:hypothetical protein LD13_gp049 [Bacillus phage Bobb]|uniref:Uncharacterized protein n=1 Tax=Bacillus phage Bobb TaxID=1527469 RepID=A0A076GD80_9CAUD|nr:hypothetical protein LD13_gp049 [Bacillus phage Bobb]AII27950.1 hypothetical protein [Bacillus phage Bobb]
MKLFKTGDIVRIPSRPSEGLFEVVAGTENYDHLSRCNISKDGANS